MPALRTLVAILSAAYLGSMMFALGLELGGGPKESKEEKRAKRHQLIRGLAVNIIVLPFVAFGITRALHASSDISTALLLLAAAPGGRFAPQAVRLGGGDVPLAVEVTLFLAKITCFTAVPTAKWMLTLHTLGIHELPFLLQLVLIQLAPFYLGKWIRRKYGSVAERVQKPANWFAVVAGLAVFAAVLTHADRGILPLLDGRGWLAVLVVVVASPIAGWIFGGRHDGERRALAIGANAREISLALTMASFAFPDRAVHVALFGVWSLMAASSFLFASGMRAYAGLGTRFRATLPRDRVVRPQ